MLTDKQCGAVPLPEDRRHVAAIGRNRLVSFLYSAAAAICMVFSTAAVASSANAESVLDAGSAKSRTKSAVKKQDVSCDIPDASQNKPHKRDRGCLVSLFELDKLRAEKDFNLVDVRSPSEYDRYRIADSINIPLHIVKTKEFLKSTSVVLVGEGRSTTELEKLCGELKQVGFARMAVLDGGLLAWYVSKRGLEGDAIAQSKLNLMSAEELFAEHAMSGWSVIDASPQGKYKDMRPWLPANVTAISIKSKGDPIARISAAILKQRKSNPQNKLLLVADDNSAYERIDARLRKSGVASGVLRLDGGLKGYREHVAKQLALWKQENQPRRYEACRG